MKEQIKELTEIINKRCEAELGQIHTTSKDNKVTKTVGTSLISKDIINAGYHKTIWHKVADGDLPMQVGQYLCITKTGCACFNYSLVDNTFLEQDTLDKEFYITNQVVAWTELPEYKE